MRAVGVSAATVVFILKATERLARWVRLREVQEATAQRALEKAQAACSKLARELEQVEVQLRAASPSGTRTTALLLLEERAREGLRERRSVLHQQLREALRVKRLAEEQRKKAWAKLELVRRLYARREEEHRRAEDSAAQRALDELSVQRHVRRTATQKAQVQRGAATSAGGKRESER